MPKLIGIVAVSPEGYIAINDKMPWNVSEDLKYFKSTTLNNVVIMGRVTWETLNKQSLPNRINYIVSNTASFNLISSTNATVFCDINRAIEQANLSYPEKDIFIIGGASIYKQTMPIWDELYLTIINKELVNYIDGPIKTLDNYPGILNKLFIETDSKTTQYATYKKYKRKITDSINSKRFF